MTNVITYGTYDLFHVGHARLLKRARALGDYLIVGLSTDEFNAQKGKKAIFTYEDRREILLASRFVDEVLPENSWEQKRQDIQENRVGLLAMGDDWVGRFDDLEDIASVVYLPRTGAISTTEVKSVIQRITAEKLDTLDKAIEQAANAARNMRDM